MVRLVLGAALGLALAVAASTGYGQQPPTPMVIQLGSQVPSVSAMNYYVAQKVGFFAEENVALELRYTANAPTATQIVAAGNADLGSMSFEPIVFGHDKGVRGKMFLSLTKELIYYIGVPESSSIRTLEDLKGKNIGVSNMGSAAVHVVRSMMRSINAEMDRDYKIVPVGVLDQAIAALNAGRVSAVAMWDSQYAAFYRIGVPLRYIRHPTLSEFGNSGFLAGEHTIKNKPEGICGFGRAVLKSIVFMRENPAAAVRIYWEANPGARVGKDEETAMAGGMREVEFLLSTFRPYTDGQKDYGKVDAAGFQRYMQMFKDEGALKSVPPVDELATDRFIPCINQIDPAAVRARARTWTGG